MARVKLAFLDRDDTLIACNSLAPEPPPAAPGDLIDPRKVTVLPGVAEGCRMLVEAGFTLIVVSNQGSVARGAAEIAGVERVNRRVDELLRDPQGRALITRFYFCPFHPKGSIPRFAKEHDWRKPSDGMLREAMKDFGAVPLDCMMIGDAERDIEAGIRAGLKPGLCVRVGSEIDFLSAARKVIETCVE